jgi:hypothetical protein
MHCHLPEKTWKVDMLEMTVLLAYLWAARIDNWKTPMSVLLRRMRCGCRNGYYIENLV